MSADSASDTPLLSVSNLHAETGGVQILKGVEISINPGEIHAIMGRNGSGKTTTANVIMGHPDFEVSQGKVELEGEDLLALEPWERAREGVFLSFQYPQSIPGLQVGNFLRKSVASIRGEEAAKGADIREALGKAMETISIPRSFRSM